MPLKNYTSSVPAFRSISYIESKLVMGGARNILKRYNDDGNVIAILFEMNIEGKKIPFKLPARIKECEQILEANLPLRARPETKAKIPEQAQRTAWKILFDWVEVQMAMIELSQVEFMEIFLSYAIVGYYDISKEQSFFQKIKDNNFKALLPSGEK